VTLYSNYFNSRLDAAKAHLTVPPNDATLQEKNKYKGQVLGIRSALTKRLWEEERDPDIIKNVQACKDRLDKERGLHDLKDEGGIQELNGVGIRTDSSASSGSSGNIADKQRCAH